MDERKKEKIKACGAFAVVTLIILIIGIFICIYQIEGETNMPFVLSSIYVVSTAEGAENKNSEEKWNLNIYQNNDIYINIQKNEEYEKQETIQSVQIDNIQIIKNPVKGKINTYMPNSSEGRLFTFSEESKLEKNSLTYKGGSKTDTTKLEIGNQGGTIVIRFSNDALGSYISNEDEEIKHDGTMLGKINVSNEDIKFTILFDLIIRVNNISYKTTVELELPTGNILENGTESLEITDTQKYIFKRI